MDDHSLAELPISKVTCEDRPWLLQRSQWLSIKNLFFFSMIADISDIPRDLIEQVISILHISVRIVSERPDADAHEWPHTLGMPPFEASNGDSRLPYLFMLPSLANRAACCLL
ncbi:hypothetical protein EUX98_g2529 [Antrodiella citrinella]|uniref:Uncharacterized protein n=1 Tax=Antrodiella citrinella TaxID=2447956 RepID=A0A4S4MYQ8_9APHY|nr:hypothetical protein EUX98_g2529 [Antrodiella citrinella]